MQALVIRGALAAILVAASAAAIAHPTDGEIREAWEERRVCSSDVAWADRIDPIRLGASVAALHERFDDLRADPEAGSKEDEGAQTPSLLRRTRLADGSPLASVEYELWKDRVYRIRWRLGPAYERPILDELARKASTCLGAPRFDQTFEAEPGSSAATYRRIGWDHEDRRIELRQPHPLRGGAVYLTLTASEALREIGLAGRVPFPDPEQTEPWWRREMAQIEPVMEAERKRVGRAFLELLSQIDH